MTGTAANIGNPLSTENVMNNWKKGKRKKDLLRNTRDLTKDAIGKGNCFAVASGLNPDSLSARCHAALEFISCATVAGGLPSFVSMNRSEPCSINFWIQVGLPLTRAQCNAVKPFSSAPLTLAPHWRNISTHAGYPLYAAHIKHVCPEGSGPSIGMFWWRSMRSRKTLPSNVAR